MILVDSRVGSKHLAPLIRNSELTQLDSADAAFSTVDGRLVGVEVKKVNDAVQCMYTGRLADDQIPKMRATYDVCYLVVEGVYRPEPGTGVLQLWREFDSTKPVKCGQWYDVQSGRKRLMFSAFESWLSTISTLGGVSVRNTSSVDTTAALLSVLYNWWQRGDHRSFDAMHWSEGDSAVLSRPTMLRRMVALLPHIGWIRSAVLASKVGGVQFHRKDGKPMRREDWYIEREIAEKSAMDIVAACGGDEP